MKTLMTAGWGKSPSSKKWHYFDGSTSLCQRIGFYFGPLEQGGDDSADNCAECKRRLNSLRRSAASKTANAETEQITYNLG